MINAWGIKLGSGGSAVHFCEQRGVIGVGWKDVDLEVVEADNEQLLRDHLAEIYQDGYSTMWPGALRRFVNWCQPGDFVVYYVPQRKSFVVAEITSRAYRRASDLNDQTDIWIVRDAVVRSETSILEFFAPLKGRVLGPRMSFWQLRGEGETLRVLASGMNPLHLAAPDPEVISALETLRDLATTRLYTFNDKDFELLTAEFFRAQGATILGKVGADPVIDVHARFERGSLGPDDWLIQVKRYEGKAVDAHQIEELVAHAGESGNKCFVSAFGFTDDARSFADETEVYLLETSDFVPLALAGGLDPELTQKLGLPGWGALSGSET